jgi:PLD-like domain
VDGDRHGDRGRGGAELRLGLTIKGGCALLLLAWLSVGVWNSVKPLPPGTRVMSLPVRLVESDVALLVATTRREILNHAMGVVEHAEQLIVIDQSPLARELSQALLVRKQARPNLKIVLITDPAPEALGGTPPQDLQTLERAGIIVARVRLDRLRDSNVAYSSLWRILVGWWSDPFQEVNGSASVASWSRQFNFKADQRQVLTADDGSGIWTSLIGAPDSGYALSLRGALAHDILASELQIAGWSDDDRLPGIPPAAARSIGTIDARFLTEGAIGDALLDALASVGKDDQIFLLAHHLGDRRVVSALLEAAGRGARLRVLLDPVTHPNLATAAELMRAPGARIELRWTTYRENTLHTQMTLVRHRNDVSIYAGSANLTRRNLGDFNLEAAVELRLPTQAVLGRSFSDCFDKLWSKGASYESYADGSAATLWSYRFAEASGLSSF